MPTTGQPRPGHFLDSQPCRLLPLSDLAICTLPLLLPSSTPLGLRLHTRAPCDAHGQVLPAARDPITLSRWPSHPARARPARPIAHPSGGIFTSRRVPIGPSRPRPQSPAAAGTLAVVRCSSRGGYVQPCPSVDPPAEPSSWSACHRGRRSAQGRALPNPCHVLNLYLPRSADHLGP